MLAEISTEINLGYHKILSIEDSARDLKTNTLKQTHWNWARNY